MKVVIIGINPQAYIYGSLFSSLGVEVIHYVSSKRTMIKEEEGPTKIILDHYYPEKGKFIKKLTTKSFYKPRVVSDFPKKVDLCIFAGCYDQVITHVKKLSTRRSVDFNEINCLIQTKSWKSLEYLQTILGTNPTYWISPMVEGYFTEDGEERMIKGMFIKKTALQIDSLQYNESVNFALLLAEILRVDFFEVTNILQANRVFISLYTPFVLYIVKYIEDHWMGRKKQLAFIINFFKETQPFLYDHIIKNGPFKEVREFSHIYVHDDLKIKQLITNIVNKESYDILSTFIQSSLRNKYGIDEAIDLATEMIRWYAYFEKDVRGLKALFDEKRVIWESAYLKEISLEGIELPKTLLLEKTEK